MSSALRKLLEAKRPRFGKFGIVFRSEADTSDFKSRLITWMLMADYHGDTYRVELDGKTVWINQMFEDQRRTIDGYLRSVERPVPVDIVFASDTPAPEPTPVKHAAGATASSQEQTAALRKALDKRPDAALEAALNAIQQDASWVSDAGEEALKKIRHALYQRGMKKEADLFRL